MLKATKSLFCALLIVTVFHSGYETDAAPPAGTAVYAWRPDLGGWLDTSKNLIWGYSATSAFGSNYSFDYANTTVVANYAAWLSAHGYPTEGAAAAHYSNWRLPTLSEYQGAWSKGFFTTGPDGFNYDDNPEVGNQGIAYGGGLTWTSTPGTGKDKKSIYAFNTFNGGNMAAAKGSSIYAIVVRTHVP